MTYNENDIFLITGGTGSFGRTMVKHLMKSNVGEIRIFSRDEKKQEELRFEHNSDKLKFFIGDVRDTDALKRALPGTKYVFHAAALKQVPSCEFHPIEAIKTNVIGAENVMQSCIDNKVKRCVVLSTDKAVYPINAMGMSKALMEKAMIAKSYLGTDTTFCATRYGNVMASRGSVIPLFIQQLKNNQELTITDVNMTRFLMSLNDSVDLVNYAFQLGLNGHTYVQKQKASTVIDLAHAIGAILAKKVNINIIGIRHGEKIYETLISKEEMLKAIDHGEYYEIPCDKRSLNYNNYEREGSLQLSEINEYNSQNADRLKGDALINFLIEKLGRRIFHDNL